MKIQDEKFSYYITEDKKREFVIGLKQYFQEYLVEGDKCVSQFINSKIIGTLMFELLQREDIEYSRETQNKIEYIKFYLDKCIENNEYCNNKIFLPCVQECIGGYLPKSDLHFENIYTIEQKCDYNVIHSDVKKKTDIIFNNRNSIDYSKIYYCNKIEDLFVASLFELFDRHYIIRKCKNCNKFFVTIEKGKRIKYCYNNSPQNKNKSCYEYCSQQTYVEKRRENPIQYEYTRLFNKYKNRYIRAENALLEKYSSQKEDLCKEELEELKDIYKSMKEEMKSGRITENEVYLILKEYDNGGKEKWKYKR